MRAVLLTALWTFAALTAPAAAQVAADAPVQSLLHPLFQDHAVLQRDWPIPVWGWAAPKSPVTVRFVGHDYSARSDKDGLWRLDLPATPAGGPYDLTVTAGAQATTVHDILLGDVYLCSGQSNMQFMVRQSRNMIDEIARSADDSVRLLQFDRRNSPVPLSLPPSQIHWAAASPQTVPDFSAVCYFFGREIARTHHIPVGLIHSSWGGSIIQDWLPANGLKALGNYDAGLDTLAQYAKDPAAADAAVKAGTSPWSAANDPGTAGRWDDPSLDDQAWGEVILPRVWEELGRPELVDFDGVVWFRKHVTLTAEQAAKPSTLHLGTVDERDTTFVNGAKVGETIDYRVERAYPVPAGLLHAGDNIIAVRAIDEGGGGGLRSTADKLFLDLGPDKLSLAGPWRYRIAGDFKTLPHPPFIPWVGAKGYTTLYNGMIAPIGPYGLTGVLWFQGEQNVGDPTAYARLLPEMIGDWRRQFRGDLPFLVVQLTNYGNPNLQPEESGFAGIRDVQRRTVAATPNTGLAVAIDLGNPRDIHSPEKQEVARRLTLEAERVIYGHPDTPGSPVPLAAVRDGATIRVSFSRTGQGLVTQSGLRPLGFELCGTICTWADARLDGDTVVLDAVPGATKVRYAWAGAPVVNLYNRDGLPVSPFEITISGAQ